MDLREISRQEDLIAVVQRTMQPVWSEHLGKEVRISRAPLDARSQPWQMNQWLGAFYSEDPAAAPRKFMADRFRFTANWLRLPFQWAYGSYLVSRPRLRTGEVGFFVTPGLPKAPDILVVPGSRRIRTFDFSRGTTRSYLKAGYSAEATAREIEVRATGEGPFPRIVAKSPQNTWFEEEILSGYTLPRIPPWWNRKTLERLLLLSIAEWLAARVQPSDAGEYISGLMSDISEALRLFAHQYPAHAQVVNLNYIRSLEMQLNHDQVLLLSQSHGDLQPGNVHLTPGREVYFLDWEFSALRHQNYDLLTYGLSARWPIGLAGRVQRFVATGDLGLVTQFLEGESTREVRKRLVTLYLLEEIARATRACVSSPFVAPPIGYLHLWSELRQLGSLNTSG